MKSAGRERAIWIERCKHPLLLSPVAIVVAVVVGCGGGGDAEKRVRSSPRQGRSLIQDVGPSSELCSQIAAAAASAVVDYDDVVVVVIAGPGQGPGLSHRPS